MRKLGRLVAGLFVVGVVGLGAPAVAMAFDVNTTVDETSVDGSCSLREAILQANGTSEPDCTSGTASIINVPAGTYTLGMGQLSVNPGAALTIAGAGAATTTIDAATQSRIFNIATGPVTISGLTLENGRSVGAPSSLACPASPTGTASGGAIFDEANLTLTDDVLKDNLAEGDGGAIEDQSTAGLSITGSTLSDNLACTPQSVFPSFGNGGGIDESEGDTVTIDSSTISGNQAALDGGGVDEASGINSAGGGSLFITDSAVTGNTASNGNGGGVAGEGPFGGGSGTISLVRDQISGNSAGDGGGVGGDPSDSVSIVNTTITGNTTSGNGGGVDQTGNSATISFSTINGNTATGSEDVNGRRGGNLANGNVEISGTFNLDDSIVSGGTGATSPDNCADFSFGGGAYTDNGYNLFDDTSDSGAQCGATAGTNDVITSNPQLGKLTNNGGPTKTEGLMAGSPAINAANPDLTAKGPCANEAQDVDQRGFPRPVGPACDIGAFEGSINGGGGGGPTTPTVSTTVFDAATNSPWAGNETAGASAYDSANLGGTTSGVPSGSVTYSLFDNGTCSGTPASTDTETLNSDGNVGNSKPTGPLAAGSYSYQASYSGDANYNAATGPCEPFAVGQAPSQGPDLRLTASTETDPIVVSEQDVVTDTITNEGGSDATNVHFSDPAAGFSIGSVKASQGGCRHTATTVSCSLGTIRSGQQATVQISLTGNSTGKITLNSHASMAQTDPTPADNSATTTIRVKRHSKPLADLAITVTPSANPLSLHQAFKYTLLASNHGPDKAQDVVVTDRVPSGVTLLSVRSAGSAAHCSGTQVIRCRLPGLAKFGRERILLRVRAEQTGTALDLARVTDASPTDPNLRNNVDRARVDVLRGPVVSIGPLARACYPERSRIAIRATASAPAGIKRFALRVGGRTVDSFIGHAPAPTHHTLRVHLPGVTFLVGRTYSVIATVKDTLGQTARAESHFTMCQSRHRQGFTG